MVMGTASPFSRARICSVESSIHVTPLCLRHLWLLGSRVQERGLPRSIPFPHLRVVGSRHLAYVAGFRMSPPVFPPQTTDQMPQEDIGSLLSCFTPLLIAVSAHRTDIVHHAQKCLRKSWERGHPGCFPSGRDASAARGLLTNP